MFHSDRLKSLLVAAILAFAVFPHVYQLYLDRGPSFGPDEGLQIAAAKNLAAGLGYNTQVLTNDLSKLRYRHLHGWPAGYSVTLWGLHSLGLDWVSAVFGFKVVVILLAVVGWFLMACRVLGSTVWAAALMVLVPYRFMASPTDMLCIAVTPFLLMGLEKVRGGQTTRPQLLLIIGLSFLASLIVVFKYSAVYLVGVGLFWLVGLRWMGARQGIGLGRLALYILPPLLLFVAIMIWNETQAANTWMARAGRETDEFRFWSYFGNPFKALLIQTFQLVPWIERLAMTLSSFMPLSIDFLRQVFSAMVVVVLLGAFVHYLRTEELPESQRMRLRLLVLCFLASGAFLIMMSVLYQARAFSTMYRYYLPVAPMVLLFLVHIGYRLLRSSARPSKGLGVATLLICLLGVVAYGPREYYRTLKGQPLLFDEGVSFLAGHIERISRGEPRVVLGTMHSFAATQSLNVIRLKSVKYWRRAHTTQPMWLFLVRITERTPGSFHFQHRFAEVESKFAMDKISHREFELYFKKVEPGDFD